MYILYRKCDIPNPQGATLFQSCPDVCVEKRRTWVIFRLHANAMSEKMSFKIGVKFAASRHMHQGT